jgi:hypothetical protein
MEKVEQSTPSHPIKASSDGKDEVPKEATKSAKKNKSEKIGFNVNAVPAKDINPLTGKKLKKRSKEAYERRKARYLAVKQLDSRNKRAQAEFEANQKWLNSTPSASSSINNVAPTYSSF